MSRTDAIVVGGGVAGLCAAALIAHRGLSVRLIEGAPKLGGKAGSVRYGSAELDTGPSVLTLPKLLESVLEEVGVPKEERFECVELNPSFRYVFPSGGEIDVYHDKERTLESIEATLGSKSRKELEEYLAYARRIWEAAAPHFIMAQAPELGRILAGGPRVWGSVNRIDPFRTLRTAIRARVKTPELVAILERYATYNGSDARNAPATLGCIAHVELDLGGYGVRGGMRSLVLALQRALDRTGVRVQLEEPVEEVLFRERRTLGVRTQLGTYLADSVVLGADLPQWRSSFLGQGGPASELTTPSMSAYNALFLGKRADERAPHTVFFPRDYEREFADIFDEGRVPKEPTLYVCALDRCHEQVSFPDREPLFTMINAPSVRQTKVKTSPETLLDWMRENLEKHDLLGAEGELIWSRTPEDLAREFPGSDGALYGPASNSMMAAFRRLPNRIPGYAGLYVASGSAHPGGGIPLAAQSGRLAADCVVADRGISS